MAQANQGLKAVVIGSKGIDKRPHKVIGAALRQAAQQPCLDLRFKNASPFQRLGLQWNSTICEFVEKRTRQPTISELDVRLRMGLATVASHSFQSKPASAMAQIKTACAHPPNHTYGAGRPAPKLRVGAFASPQIHRLWSSIAAPAFETGWHF